MLPVADPALGWKAVSSTDQTQLCSAGDFCGFPEVAFGSLLSVQNYAAAPLLPLWEDKGSNFPSVPRWGHLA